MTGRERQMSGEIAILVVDPDADARALVRFVAAGRLGAASVIEASGALEFAAALADGAWSAAVVEPDLPWAAGQAVVEQLCERHPERPVFVFASHENADDAVRTVGAGAVDYIVKGTSGAVRLADGLARALGAGNGVAGAARAPEPSAGGPRQTGVRQTGVRQTGVRQTTIRPPAPDYHDRWRTLARQAREQGYADFEVRALENAVELQPDDEEVVERLIALHGRADRWRRVAELLSLRAGSTTEPAALRRIYKRLIAVQTERLGDAEAGIESYVAWRASDPDNDELRRGLIDLLERLERWSTLATVQRALADEAATPARRAGWLIALGRTLASHLDGDEESAELFAEAARLAPTPSSDAKRSPEPAQPAAAPPSERPTRPFRIARNGQGTVLELVSSGGEALAIGDGSDEELPPPVPMEAMEVAPEGPRETLRTLAHDLQEPIRSVANYLSVLESRYGADLADEGRTLVDKARGAARRMQERVHSLVQPPTPATNRPSVVSSVDCEALVHAAVSDLQAAIEASGGSVEVGELPRIDGDEQSLGRLFQNLVSNGLKFRAEAPPLVRIDATRQGEGWCFAVRDNGIGIDHDDQKRVFEMFSRGSHESAFPGSGIGLAVCKRIVESHGGRIWLESAPWQGTTVLFTLPARAAEAADGPEKVDSTGSHATVEGDPAVEPALISRPSGTE